MMAKLVLIAEDEAPQREALGLYLIKEGFQVLEAASGSEAWDKFLKSNPDLVILDLMLPDISGERLCVKIREVSRVPIFMITAKVQEDSVLNGFSLGADDYIRKPASPREVVARIKARLKENQSTSFLQCPEIGLSVDLLSRAAQIQGLTLDLTNLEIDLLLCFLKQPKRVFTREDLIKNAWPHGFEGMDRTVDVHIKNLRKKIGSFNNGCPLETVYGQGYRWDPKK